MNPGTSPAKIGRDLVLAAARALKERSDEVNRLNVFPVPDGDTGTNMSLTMDTVVREVSAVPDTATLAQVCHAVSHGSLMGARGNSGVILSQILRGLCEGIDDAPSIDTALLASSLDSAVTVSFQAVRKPVEGTMLTVIRDVGEAARAAADEGLSVDDALERIVEASFESVRRTPELLPVLKENGVVDAGGFGLAILLEGFVASALGRSVAIGQVSSEAAPLLSVQPVDDWDDDEYLYCTEFLLFGEHVDRDKLEEYVSVVGGSELVVGTAGEYKVHVHTNDPGGVLSHVTTFGEVAEVHVNNMRRQQAARDAALRSDAGAAAAPSKPVGFVAVASGEGLRRILESLGVDVVVSGGQTMNPSTEDLLAAIDRVPAESVIILPNNKNIVMAANAAASVSRKSVSVVPTTSVPASFAALLAFDGGEDVEHLVAEMGEAARGVRTGEVTIAVKDAKAKVGQIKAGQHIGIIDDQEIEAVGDDVDLVAEQLIDLLAQDAETMTVFAGEDYSDQRLAALHARISERYPGLEIETHRGEQPLYPLIISVE